MAVTGLRYCSLVAGSPDTIGEECMSRVSRAFVVTVTCLAGIGAVLVGWPVAPADDAAADEPPVTYSPCNGYLRDRLLPSGRYEQVVDWTVPDSSACANAARAGFAFRLIPVNEPPPMRPRKRRVAR